MNYRSELSAFHDCLEKWDLSSCEISLWHALWDVAMICGSTDSLSVAASTLAFRTGFQKKSIERARKRLSDCGIIRYKSRGGNKSAVYDLISLVRHTDAQSDPQTIPQDGVQTIPQTDPHTTPIYTTTMVNSSSYIKRHTDAQSDPQTIPQDGVQTIPQTDPHTTPIYTTTMVNSSSYIKRHTDAQSDPQTIPQDTPQPFMTDAEAFALQAAIDDVLTAAANIGIPQNASDLDEANALIADYSAPWVLEAVRRAGKGPANVHCWRYVRGTLRNWRNRGGIDEEGATAQTAQGDRETREEQERKRREEERTLALLRGELSD